MLFVAWESVQELWFPLLVLGLPGVIAVLKIHSLHVQVNHRMDELLETTRKLATSEGFKKGAQDERLKSEQTARDVLEKTDQTARDLFKKNDADMDKNF
jgi:hypothetical protein